MHKINYIKGDATAPQIEVTQKNGTIDGKPTSEHKIIVHICNDIGGWGKGFVMALSKKWLEPEKAYRLWYKSQNNFELGKVQFVKVENDLWIANMIGQHKIGKDKQGNAPIRYAAVEAGIKEVLKKAIELNASVHMPRIGCGLAGGKWDKIEPILLDNLVKNEIRTVVYDF